MSSNIRPETDIILILHDNSNVNTMNRYVRQMGNSDLILMTILLSNYSNFDNSEERL